MAWAWLTMISIVFVYEGSAFIIIYSFNQLRAKQISFGASARRKRVIKIVSSKEVFAFHTAVQ